MAEGYGQTTTTLSQGGATLSADGVPEYVPGGITIDWATVPANAAGATLDDGQVIEAGVKFIPFGTVLAKITASGKYGPHQAGATADGRQTVAKGGAYLLNQTVREDDAGSEFGPGAFEGGLIYQGRLKRANDAGGAFIAHAVDATFNLAFPRIRFAEH